MLMLILKMVIRLLSQDINKLALNRTESNEYVSEVDRVVPSWWLGHGGYVSRTGGLCGTYTWSHPNTLSCKKCFLNTLVRNSYILRAVVSLYQVTQIHQEILKQVNNNNNNNRNNNNNKCKGTRHRKGRKNYTHTHAQAIM